jgi:predicted metal-dependent HD superfamily phosphohydrolase
MRRLLEAYNEPHRKYHTLRHLLECLDLFDAHREIAVAPAEVEMALWFHDAVYGVFANDNEARSADWAGRALLAAGVKPQRIERIKSLILATRHSILPEDADEKLIVDLDLAILGASRDRFNDYETRIRGEYYWAPESLYREKRIEILKEFLARTPIYQTPDLRNALETSAAENLRYAIDRLS